MNKAKTVCTKCTRPTSGAPYGPRCASMVEAAVAVLLGDPKCNRKVSCRMAAELLISGSLNPIPGRPKTWSVPSSRDANVIYVVTPDSCVCPAAVWNQNTVMCRHRLAAIVLAA